MKFTFTLMLLLISCAIKAENKPIPTKKWDGKLAHAEAVFMTKGPNQLSQETLNAIAQKKPSNASGRFYRLYFILSEIYYSVLLEEMTFSGEEGSLIKTQQAYFANGIDIADGVRPLKGLTNLKFVKWNAWNSFTVTEQKTELTFHINPDQTLSVEKR